MVACCRCSESGTCIRCVCAKAGRSCDGCCPGKLGRCANSCARTTTPDMVADPVVQPAIDSDTTAASPLLVPPASLYRTRCLINDNYYIPNIIVARFTVLC